MKFELEKKEIKALFDFAEAFNKKDITKMVGDKLTEKQIYNFDNVLDSIFKAYQDKL